MIDGLTPAGIKTAAASWLAEASGLPSEKVLVATGTPDPKGVRTSKPYAMVRIISDIEVGQDQRWEGDAVGDAAVERIICHRKAMADFLVMGEGAADFCAAVRRAISKQRFIDLYNTLGLKVVGAGAILDLSRLLDTDYEERATVELTLTYAYEDIEGDVGTVEDVALTGTIEDTVGPMTVTVDTR